jgi:2-polyprenyl-3-methyl-5-hydroxy-6-metoxy-1,4-benzoquinol methylase
VAQARNLQDHLIAGAYRLARLLKPARERVTLGERGDHVEREHVARYQFAKQYCAGKRVADIACGSGYGSEILRTVAASVDSYDRDSLCGNYVIDLEKSSWNRPYEVIVSFETIEHLANPEFFLDNARSTAQMLIVSTPIGERWGYNPHHKQVWTLEEFAAVLRPRFTFEFFHQQGEQIQTASETNPRFVIAVCKPTH